MWRHISKTCTSGSTAESPVHIWKNQTADSQHMIRKRQNGNKTQILRCKDYWFIAVVISCRKNLKAWLVTKIRTNCHRVSAQLVGNIFHSLFQALGFSCDTLSCLLPLNSLATVAATTAPKAPATIITGPTAKFHLAEIMFSFSPAVVQHAWGRDGGEAAATLKQGYNRRPRCETSNWREKI